MSEMEDKLGAVLSNPDMMEKIMAMAQSLTQSQPQQADPQPSMPPVKPQQLVPGVDPGTLQRVFSVAQQTNIDKNQQSLLRSLGPYLARERLMKLEKAMRAAKIAGIAATALGSSKLITGR